MIEVKLVDMAGILSSAKSKRLKSFIAASMMYLVPPMRVFNS